MPKPTLARLSVISLILLWMPAVCPAVVITGSVGATPNAANHVDRYENHADFLSLANIGSGAAYDFTGVGQSGSSVGGSGLSKWATMISPTTFLSASHSHPTAGTSVTFSDGNGSGIATHTVAGGFALENTDLWVGQLTSAVDTSQIAIYDVASSTSNFHLGMDVLQVGIGGSSPAFRVGQNRLDTLILTSPGVVNQSVFSIYLDNSAAGGLNSQAGQALNTSADPLLAYETYFQAGDSGAPSFVADGSGGLSVLGIHSFVAEFSADRRGSADVYLPYYGDEIQAAIPTSATAVPEPSSFLFLLVSVLGAGLRRNLRLNGWA